jgi:hypothetical protein
VECGEEGRGGGTYSVDLYFSALRVTAVFVSGRDEAGAGDALHLNGNGGDCFFGIYVHDDLAQPTNQISPSSQLPQKAKETEGKQRYIPSQ